MPYVQVTQTPEQNEYMKLVNEFGNIEYKQLAKFFPDWDEDTLRYHTQQLYNKYKIDIVEGSVVLSYLNKTVDHNMIDCLWVALEDIDKIRKGMIFRAESPLSLVAQYNDGTFREFIKVDLTTLDNLFMVEERHFTRTIENSTDRAVEYVLICDNENVLKSIEDYNFKPPYTTALLQFDSEGKPIISGTFNDKTIIDA